MKRLSALVVIVLLFSVAGCDTKPKRKVTPEGYAPEFTLLDLEGNPVSLTDFRGKVVMLEFWATWCPPCKLAIPELNEVHEKYKDANFAVLGISIDEDLDYLKTYVKENNVTFTVLHDNKKVNQDYGVYSIPTTVIVDKDGKLLKTHMGFAPGIYETLIEEFKDKIEVKDRT